MRTASLLWKGCPVGRGYVVTTHAGGHYSTGFLFKYGLGVGLAMKIGVISDTHTPSVSKEPPPEVAKAFEGVDLILHAGDIYIPSCLDWLERIAPVKAVELESQVHFSMDGRVAEKQIVELEGHTIGMVHDLMLPGMSSEVRPGVIENRFPKNAHLPVAVMECFGAAVNIVVFGHTHQALIEEHQGILLVNPGSPSLPMQTYRLGQVAILELSPGGGRKARIVELASFS